MLVHSVRKAYVEHRDQLRRRRSPNGEREAAAFTTTLPERPPRGAVSCIASLGGTQSRETPKRLARELGGSSHELVVAICRH